MLTTSAASLLDILMTHDEQQFFKELGARIAQLRKEAGLSQQAVADALEIAQQTYANYEVALARPAVSMLPTLLQKQIERLNQLPKAQQKIVMQMLDGVLSQSSR
jgi:DNA-binding XRE family transcriptional regulator